MKTTKKTEISVTIYEARVELTANSTQKYEWFDYCSNKPRKETEKRKLSTILYSDFKKSESTDLFYAVCEKYVPKMVYTALKTVYCANPTQKIYNLMCECVQYSKTTQDNKEMYAQYAQKEHGTNKLMRYKWHRYKVVESIFGKKYRVETIPYKTEHLTDFGQDLFTNEQKHLDLDVNDLMQIAFVSCYELLSLNLVNCASDLWAYRYYVYKKINNYINREKRDYKKNNSLYICDKDGKEHIVSVPACDNILKNIEKDYILMNIVDLLKCRLRDNKNADKIIDTFNGYFIFGWTTRQIADYLQKDQKQIMRYLEKIRKELNSPEIFEIVRQNIIDAFN